MKDAYGKIPKVGDIIVYATRQSSNMTLYKAEVLEVQENKMRIMTQDHSWWRGRTDNVLERETWLRASNFVIAEHKA